MTGSAAARTNVTGRQAAGHRTDAASLGMLGGTFDPIHVGHLGLARAAVDQLGLERLLLVPAGRPPHKPGGAIVPGEDRLAMIELAIAGDPRLSASRIELDRPGPSYTVDTVEALLGHASQTEDDEPAEVIVVLSAESVAGLATWHDPARLLRLAKIAVAPRPGHPAPTRRWLAEHLPAWADRIVVLDGPHLEVSASDIRARIASGRSIEGLVPPPVAAYIEAHHLYREQPNREDPT